MEGSERGSSSGKPGRSLRQAVITAIVLLGLIVVFNLLGPTGFFFLAAAVVGLALYEIFTALKGAGLKADPVLGVTGGLALVIVAGPLVEEPILVVPGLAAVAYLAFLLALLPGRSERPASDVAWTLLPVAWIGGGGAGAVYILTLSDDGALLLTAYVLVTALNDIGAYFIGTAFGRHKIVPSISPNKSWEGWVGGLLTSLAGGALFGTLLSDLGTLEGLGLGVVSSLFAPLGDLSESLFKREMGIKDSGVILPGHGGILDRIDAIVFAAPPAALYLHFVIL